jgi:hypothetical protein
MADPKGLNYTGSMQGQIKTPMSAENVDNQGDGKVHSYKNITGEASGEAGKGGIKGPGAQGNWDASKTIKGTNTGKY